MSKHHLLVNLVNTPENFKAGNVGNSFSFLTSLTSDSHILSMIRGLSIDFCKTPVCQPSEPKPLIFSDVEQAAASIELTNILDKNIIQPATPCSGQYVANIFLRHKKDQSHRVILNLRELNQHITYVHFKMDNLRTALDLVTNKAWFCTIDLKDAYYSLSIKPSHRKFLRFYWEDSLFEFTCLPQGLSEGPRKFTAVVKVILAELRRLGIIIIGYLDDTLILADSERECYNAVFRAVSMFDKAGFTIHPDKSVLDPTQIITFLGFIISSKQMTVQLTLEKREKIRSFASRILNNESTTLIVLAEFIGLLVASGPGVHQAALHYKGLEIERDQMLKCNNRNYNCTISLSRDARADVVWWRDNVMTAVQSLNEPPVDHYMQSDSSDFAWGGYFAGTIAGGPWSVLESARHINYKELLAAHLTLQSFCRTMSNVHSACTPASRQHHCCVLYL